MLRQDQPTSPTDGFEIIDEPGAEPVSDSPTGVERRGGSRLRLDKEKLESMLSDFQEDAPEGAAGETGERPNVDRRQGDRKSMEHLRAEYTWSVAPDAKTNVFSDLRTGISRRRGFLKPSRMFAIVVAVLSASMALYVSTRTAEPVAQVAAPIKEMVPEPRLKVLVAKNTIKVGQRLLPESVVWEDWPEASVRTDYITLVDAPEAANEMDDSIARLEIFPGEPIRKEKLVQADHGYLSALLDGGLRGVSVRVTADSASGGFIKPNDHVDVVMTRTLATGQVSETVLRNARVLAINSQLGEAATRGAPSEEAGPESGVFMDQAIATLALSPVKAEVLINASMIGSLALVLRSIADFAETDEADAPGVNHAIRISSPFWNESGGRANLR